MTEKSNITPGEVARLLSDAKSILLVTHARPDGDTVGSAFALLHALPGRDVRVICADRVSERLSFLSGGERSLTLDEGFAPELVCAVDAAELSMMGEYGERFRDCFTLKIDHHRTSVPFARFNLIDDTAAACGEIVFDIVEELGTLNDDCALALYSAIATDTGCFRFRNVSARSHRVAARLLEFDFDAGKINNLLFERKSASEITALRVALNNLHFYENKKIAVVNFSNDLKRENGICEDDLSGLNGLTREIDGVELGITIKQSETESGLFKLSMRSGENVDASALCGLFGGGGHLRAAGAELRADSADEAERVVVDAVRESVKNV